MASLLGDRRKALGVKVLQPYDVWAPLSKKKVAVPFEQAVDWICDGLAPMGDDYVRLMRKGCLEDRWVDRSPNAGKRQGAFSNRSTPDMHPFILMSYNDNVGSMSTLAHELGHSMHGYLSCRAQPMIYTQYSSVVAETASNFHQVMTRAHLLDNNKDKNFQINVLEEAMGNFHRYFFIMPTLARFELETHQRIEKGQALTADSMIELMADLFSEGYGGKMNVDRQRVGITWGTFTTHMYIDYYSFQYSIGISAAHALGKRILDHQPNAVEDYLNFLKAGSSVYGIELFKQAGVDMTTTKPIEDTFAVLEGVCGSVGEIDEPLNVETTRWVVSFFHGDAVTTQKAISAELRIFTQFRNVVPITTSNRFQLFTCPPHHLAQESSRQHYFHMAAQFSGRLILHRENLYPH